MSRTVVKSETFMCDLCYEQQRTGENFTAFNVRDNGSVSLRNPQQREKHICGNCKAKLLEEWNAYCR